MGHYAAGLQSYAYVVLQAKFGPSWPKIDAPPSCSWAFQGIWRVKSCWIKKELQWAKDWSIWVRFLVASIYTPCYHLSRPGFMWVRFLVASAYTPCYHLSRPGLIWGPFLVAFVYTSCYHLSRPGLSWMLQEVLYALFSVMKTRLCITYNFILVKRGVLPSAYRNINPTCSPISGCNVTPFCFDCCPRTWYFAAICIVRIVSAWLRICKSRFPISEIAVIVK